MLQTETLLERCRAGDEQAWEELVRRYQGRVFAVTLRFLRDREEARDVAQDVFVALYQKLDRVPDDRVFLAWLLRLTRNRCVDRLRRLDARRWKRTVPVDEANALPDAAPDPEARRAGAGRRDLVRRALRRLGATSREVILLKEVRELKLTEVAAHLGLPVGTVKSRAHRARLELAEAVRAIEGSAGRSAGPEQAHPRGEVDEEGGTP